MSFTRRRFLGTGAALGLGPLLGRVRLPGVRSETRAGGGEDHGGWDPEDGASLAFAGDVFLNGRLADHRGGGNDFARRVLGSADASFVNLENGLSTVGSAELGGFPYGPAIRGEPALVEELTSMGVTAVSLANNHTGNFGREALLETVETLEGAGVRHAGAGRDRAGAFGPAILEVGGHTVAFHSIYTLYHRIQGDDLARPETPGIAGCLAYDVIASRPDALSPAGMRAENDPPYLMPVAPGGSDVLMASFREDVRYLEERIRESRARADLVVLSIHFHWGRHLRSDLPAHQRALTHAAVDAGADVVVGHGPHALRGLELYRGRPILYSLGNFRLRPLEDGAPRPSVGDPDRRGVVLRVVFDPEISGLEVVPVVIPGRDGRPGPADEGTAAEILAHFRGLSAPFGTEILAAGGRGRVDGARASRERAPGPEGEAGEADR